MSRACAGGQFMSYVRCGSTRVGAALSVGFVYLECARGPARDFRQCLLNGVASLRLVLYIQLEMCDLISRCILPAPLWKV